MKTKKEQFNYEFIRNAEQFLKDLNDAKNESLYYNHEKTKYWDVPDMLQNRYNQAMQNLGRWLVRDYQEEDEYMDALESTGDTDF